MRIRLFLASGALGISLIASFGSAQEQATEEPSAEAAQEGIRQTSMGPICWAAIVEATLQISRRCYVGENLETVAALEDASNRLGRAFVESGWTAEYLEGFRKQMGEADTPSEILCSNSDSTEFAAAIAQSSPDYIKAQTEEMLDRPGPPEWGTCL